MLRFLEQAAGIISGEYVLYDNGYGKQDVRSVRVGRDESRKRMEYYGRIQPTLISVLNENNIPFTNMVIIGSVRDGLAKPDSDIDVMLHPPLFNDLDVWKNWIYGIERTMQHTFQSRVVQEHTDGDPWYEVQLFAARPPEMFTIIERD